MLVSETKSQVQLYTPTSQPLTTSMRARSSPQHVILLLLLLFVKNINVIDAFTTSPQWHVPFAAANRSRRVPVSTIIPLEMKKKDDAPDADASSPNNNKERSKQIVSIVMFPFVALFGLDLLLNIAVLTKKTILFFVTGQDQVSPPWW
jgi:hypothetical protein